MVELPQYRLSFKWAISTIRCFTSTSKDGFGLFLFLALKTKRKLLKAWGKCKTWEEIEWHSLEVDFINVFSFLSSRDLMQTNISWHNLILQGILDYLMTREEPREISDCDWTKSPRNCLKYNRQIDNKLLACLLGSNDANGTRKRHLKNIWEMATILWLSLLPRILQCWMCFHVVITADGQNIDPQSMDYRNGRP